MPAHTKHWMDFISILTYSTQIRNILDFSHSQLGSQDGHNGMLTHLIKFQHTIILTHPSEFNTVD